MLRGLRVELLQVFRGLFARPGFALVAIASLGIGIGLNTAIFSLAHQLLVQELPVADPHQLVNLSSPGPVSGYVTNDGGGRDVFSYPMFRDLQALDGPLEGVAAHRSLMVNLALEGETEAGLGMLVSGSYFSLLGLQPALGRLLVPGDDAQGSDNRVAVLAHDYWQRRLGADPGVVGRLLRVNGQSLTVVGVAPEGFAGTSPGMRPSVFVPVSLHWELEPQARFEPTTRNAYWLYLFARLSPGVSAEQAQRELDPAYRRILVEVEAPLQNFRDAKVLDEFRAKPLLLEPGARGQSVVGARAVKPLTVLAAVAVLVLLIACLNIANLLLARGHARAGELALRVSLGATRTRLLRLVLLEALVLAALGAAASVPLALGAMQVMLGLIPEVAASILSPTLDRNLIVFTALVAVAAALVFGLLPAMGMSRASPMQALRAESGRSSGGRAAARFRSLLATLQVAMSLAALVMSGLFAMSLANLSRVELGIEPERVAVFGVSPGRSGYDLDRARRLNDRIESELKALPGVTSVSSSLVPLVGGGAWGSNVTVEGRDANASDSTPFYNHVGADYFQTLGIPLLAGRSIQARDQQEAAKVAVVSRRFAEAFGLGAQPIGKRMAIGSGPQLDIEIVGLVEDSVYEDVRAQAQPVFYLPRWQARGSESRNHFYLRTAGDVDALLADIPRVVAGIDPDLPVEDVRTLPQQIERSLLADRFVGTLAAGFAVVATLLAALGLYGVLSFMLAQRTRELGLRLALGAPPSKLRSMVLRQVGQLTLVGVAVGLAAAFMLGRAAESQLFGVSARDPVVFAAATGLLALVALAAAWLPARRAARTDPIVALRHD